MSERRYHELLVPQENVSDDEVVITKWYVENGAKVAAGDLAVEYETSKGAFELETGHEGYLFYEKKEGDVVKVGGLLAIVADTAHFSFAEAGVVAVTSDSKPSSGPGESVRFSNAALALIEKHSIDPSVFSKKRMVRRQDVERLLPGAAQPTRAVAEGSLAQGGAQKAADGTEVLILGGGGHAKMCIDILQQTTAFTPVGIVASDLNIGAEVLGVPVLGKATELERYYKEGYRYFINAVGAITNHRLRSALYRQIKDAGFVVPNIIHPSAVVEPSAHLGEGNQIMAQAMVGSAVRVGDNCIVNSGAVVSHDCVLLDNVHLAPGATLAGNVEVGENTLIGMGVTVYLKVRIGKNVVVHNGCNITRNVPDGAIVKQ